MSSQAMLLVAAGLASALLVSAVLTLLRNRRAGRRTAIPVGPFLALGAVLPLIAVPLLVSGV